MNDPYRGDRPERADMERWFYWQPAHWRRWQVIGFLLSSLPAISYSTCSGCAKASVPVVEHTVMPSGSLGLVIRTNDTADVFVIAGQRCTYGWQEVKTTRNAFKRDVHFVECFSTQSKAKP